MINPENIMVKMDMSKFLWKDSGSVIRYFFETVHNKDVIFSKNNLDNMVLFYTGKKPLDILSLTATVCRNHESIITGNSHDTYIEMFVICDDCCMKIGCFLNEYKSLQSNPHLADEINRKSIISCYKKAG